MPGASHGWFPSKPNSRMRIFSLWMNGGTIQRWHAFCYTFVVLLIWNFYFVLTDLRNSFRSCYLSKTLKSIYFMQIIWFINTDKYFKSPDSNSNWYYIIPITDFNKFAFKHAKILNLKDYQMFKLLEIKISKRRLMILEYFEKLQN